MHWCLRDRREVKLYVSYLRRKLRAAGVEPIETVRAQLNAVTEQADDIVTGVAGATLNNPCSSAHPRRPFMSVTIN